jgi:hypothetical protein
MGLPVSHCVVAQHGRTDLSWGNKMGIRGVRNFLGVWNWQSEFRIVRVQGNCGGPGRVTFQKPSKKVLAGLHLYSWVMDTVDLKDSPKVRHELSNLVYFIDESSVRIRLYNNSIVID